jgi:L-aminopeptidase/D-esterase-like protein
MRSFLFTRAWSALSIFKEYRRRSTYMTRYNAITDVPGIKVGHWTDLEAATGCTVVLCTAGAVGGVDVRGSAPGTRETDLLNPINVVEKVHAILLGGGSAFGLAAADGVMRWLEEHGIGFDVGVARVPIVPAAILFDLGFGSAKIRPDAASGYAACGAASDGPVAQGNVGAGTGATCGKMLGPLLAMKGGLGSTSRQIEGGAIVAALVAVNAFGDVYDSHTGRIIAGARKPGGGGFFNESEPAAGRSRADRTEVSGAGSRGPAGGSALSPGAGPVAGTNTTIAVVATNAALSKSGATKVAQMAHDGLARAIRPAHTMFDGDTVFALSTGSAQADVSRIGAVAADVLAEAVLAAVLAAESMHGLPAVRNLR